jgi:hypothetical protein
MSRWSVRGRGTVREIYWKSDTAGVEGFDDLPVTFAPGTIVAASALYNPDDQRHLVVVETTAGKVHEIFWKSDTVGVEDDDDLPVSFSPGTIVTLSGFYDSAKRRHVVAVGLTDGTVHQIFWQATTVGVEAHTVVARFPAGTIVGIAGYFSESDLAEHIIVGLSDGSVEELWTVPDV